jgi:hypothetical protein
MTAWTTLRPAVHLALAAALLAAAGLMWSWLPTKLQSWAPIPVYGTVGHRVTGRDLAVTVFDTYLAHQVTANGPLGLNRFPSKGIWVVMVLSYEPLLTPEVAHFELQADGDTFSTNLSGFRGPVQPGIPMRGPLAFEVPKVPQSVTLLVSNERADETMGKIDAPLDSQLVITTPLAGCVPRASLNLNELSHG